MYAVAFLNARERLVVWAVKADNEEEAIKRAFQLNEEGVYPLVPPRVTIIEEDFCIYHADND